MSDAISIDWIPAHPSYGSISMLRYWRLLAAERRPDDRFRCKALIEAPRESDFGRRGKLRRALSRQLGYPLRVRFATRGALAHVLDHSWAELLDAVPKRRPKVVTVHDLIPLRDPGELSPRELARFRARAGAMRSADAVVAVSEHTRDEVVDLLGIEPERVHVVPNGVDTPPAEVEAPPRDPGRLRIGSIGSTLRRKNLELLPPALRAYARGATRPPVLVRAGLRLDPELRAACVEAAGGEGFEELGRLSDAGLERFYASLDVLVVPSRHEGFGLPVLEAMARGVPVLAARATSLPEVGGEAALYFDPDDPEELAERLREVADPALAERLRAAGRERAKAFSWRRTLEGLFTVYDSVLE